VPLLHDVTCFNPNRHGSLGKEATIKYNSISTGSEELSKVFTVDSLLECMSEIPIIHGGTEYICHEVGPDTQFYMSKDSEDESKFYVAGTFNIIDLKNVNGESLQHIISVYLRFEVSLDKLNSEYDYTNKKPHVYNFSDGFSVIEDGDPGNNIIVLNEISYDIKVENSHLYIAAHDSCKIGEKTEVKLNIISLKSFKINYYNSFIVDFKDDENKVCNVLTALDQALERAPFVCCYLTLGFGELYKNLQEINSVNKDRAKNIMDKINNKLTEDFKGDIPKYFTTLHLSQLLKFLNDTNNIELTTLFIDKYLALKNSDLCFDSDTMAMILNKYNLHDEHFQAMQAKNTENILNLLQALKNSKDKGPYFEDIKAKELAKLAVFFAANKDTFSYETQTIKEPWFQIIEALGGILENDNITNQLKVHVAPYLTDWFLKTDEVSKRQLAYNWKDERSKEIKKYAENHHIVLLKAAACLEKYWSKNNSHHSSFSYFASTLALDASMPGQRNHMTFRDKTILLGFLITRFNKFLEKVWQGVEEPELLKDFSELTDVFIPELRYFVFSDYACFDSLAIMLYQLTSLIKNKSLKGDGDYHASNIIKKYCEKIYGNKVRLPDYVLYLGKKIDFDSIIYYSSCFVDQHSGSDCMDGYSEAIKEYLPYSTWDEANKDPNKIGPIYYDEPSMLQTLSFVLLAGFSVFSMLLYTNAAASILLKTQLPFMISYGFLLKGSIGIIMPALSLFIFFLAHQVYKSIFTMKIDSMTTQKGLDLGVNPSASSEVFGSVIPHRKPSSNGHSDPKNNEKPSALGIGAEPTKL